ncbi:hypothetical protein [Clostridium sp.]|uniref:hypothetical protein n=1 Tax=Clostridium sp. TaxID=1506 RepID=UPI003EEDC3A5
MDEFTQKVADLISEEADKRAGIMVKETLNKVVKNLIRHLSIEDIVCDTELSDTEVRSSLQEIVDIKNNILRLCGQTENLETIESCFHLDEFKCTMEITKNKE